jgi:hypothetical protein
MERDSTTYFSNMKANVSQDICTLILTAPVRIELLPLLIRRRTLLPHGTELTAARTIHTMSQYHRAVQLGVLLHNVITLHKRITMLQT